MPKDDARRSRGGPAGRRTDPRAWLEVSKRVWLALGEDHVSVVSAGVAFLGLLALFPAVATFVAIAGVVLSPADVEARLSTFASAMPEGADQIVMDQAASVASAGGGAGWGALLGFTLALWGASRGVKALMEGITIAYNEEETRGIVVYTIVALALTLFVILGLVVAVSAAVIAPAIAAFLPLPREVEALLTYAPWPVLLAITLFGLGVFYRFGPPRRTPAWRWITPGAVVATVLWLIGSIAFSVYVANFASYNATYGALGGVIVLLTWFWLSAFVVLLGAEVNAEIERARAESEVPGDNRPS